MLKNFAVLLLFLLLKIAAISQSEYLRVIPINVGGDPFADTLLNTRLVMVKAGIKSVTAYQKPPVNHQTFASKTAYFNSNGNINFMKVCFQKAQNKDSVICMSDTLLYDNLGRAVELKLKDAFSDVYLRFETKYISETEAEFLSIGKLNFNKNIDTLTDYQFFNNKGQLIRLQQIRKGQPSSNITFSYNNDGLPDSILYENFKAANAVFRRSMKGKNKVISMENSFGSYRWMYNNSNQCIEAGYAITNNQSINGRSPSGYLFKSKIQYHYNTDGTLLEVTEERNDEPKMTWHYSYSK